MNLVKIIPFLSISYFVKYFPMPKQQSKIQKLYAGVVVDWHNSWERTENTPNALSLQRGMELIAFNLGGWTNFIYLELGKQIRSYIFSWLDASVCMFVSTRGRRERRRTMPQSVSARTVYGEMDLRLDTCICVFVFVFLYLSYPLPKLGRWTSIWTLQAQSSCPNLHENLNRRQRCIWEAWYSKASIKCLKPGSSNINISSSCNITRADFDNQNEWVCGISSRLYILPNQEILPLFLEYPLSCHRIALTILCGQGCGVVVYLCICEFVYLCICVFVYLCFCVCLEESNWRNNLVRIFSPNSPKLLPTGPSGQGCHQKVGCRHYLLLKTCSPSTFSVFLPITVQILPNKCFS